METYQIIAGWPEGSPPVPPSVRRVGRNESIPFSLDNTDCAMFLRDWKNGAEVLDADGAPLAYSVEAATELGLIEAEVLNPDGTPAPYVAPETP